ncbi:GNAT family N-acetyltransferase [Sphingobacterium hungaricum]
MEIKVFLEEDIPALEDLQQEEWDDIKPHFLSYVGSAYSFPIQVLDEGKLVGVGSTIVHGDTAWLGHIIVHSQSRGKGIGKLITNSLIDIAYAHQCKTINLVATDLGAPVYEKVGFQTTTVYYFFKDVKLPGLVLNGNYIHPYAEQFKEAILALDRESSGEDRISELQNHLQSGFVYVEEEQVRGFYLPTLGKGLVIASHPKAGVELLKLHLKSLDTVVFPKENKVALDFLYANGYKEYHIAKRMTLGAERQVKFENMYNRIGGNVG